MTARVVTFAIPCRDAGPHLRPLLESLLAQTRQDFALLLADDGSRDGSPELAREVAGDRIMVVRASKPRGLAGNFAFCASLVRTPFFCLAHQDDVYDPHYLERMLDALQADPRAALAHCRARAICENGHPIHSPAERYKDTFWRRRNGGPRVEAGPNAYGRLYRGNYICCPSVLFRTEHYRQSGGFRDDLGFAVDWELWLRLCRLGYSFARVDDVLLHYRRHDDASSRSSTRDLSRFREELQVVEDARRSGIHAGLLPSSAPPSPAFRNNLLHEAFEDLRAGDRDEVARKLQFLRDQAPALWGDPYVRTFRALQRLGPPGRALLGAGRSLAVRLGLGGARQ